MLRFTTGELREFEQLLIDAMLAGDADALEDLLARDATYVGPDGSVTGRDDDIELYRSGALRFERFEVESLDARVYGDTGVTTSIAALAGTINGSPFTARLRYSRTWIGLPSSWRVVAAHATNMAD